MVVLPVSKGSLTVRRLHLCTGKNFSYEPYPLNVTAYGRHWIKCQIPTASFNEGMHDQVTLTRLWRVCGTSSTVPQKRSGWTRYPFFNHTRTGQMVAAVQKIFGYTICIMAEVRQHKLLTVTLLRNYIPIREDNIWRIKVSSWFPSLDCY